MAWQSYLPETLPPGVTPGEYRRTEAMAIRTARRHLRSRRDPHGLSESEVVHEALLGVFFALRTFDPELGYPFSHYGLIGGIGRVRRLVRDHTRGPVPKRVWDYHHSRARAASDVPPPYWECEPLSLDEACSVPGETYADQLRVQSTPEDHAVASDLWRRLLGQLEPKEREVFERLEFGTEKQSEIGAALGYGQAHISRLYRRARARLQELYRQQVAA